MQSSRPIDRNVGCSLYELAGGHERRSGVLSAIVPHVAENRTVVADVEPREDVREAADVFGGYSGVSGADKHGGLVEKREVKLTVQENRRSPRHGRPQARPPSRFLAGTCPSSCAGRNQ